MALATATAALFCTSAIAASGDLDPAFGNQGVVATGVGESGSGIAIDSSGRMLALFESAGEVAGVARLLPDGKLDPAFSGDGLLEVPGIGEATAISVDSQGRAVLTGWTPAQFDPSRPLVASVVRLTGSGGLDSSFDHDGYRDLGNFAPTDLELRPDGRTLVAGVSGPQYFGEPGAGATFTAIQLDSSGSPDQAFGSQGRGSINFASGISLPRIDDLAIAGDGRAVLVGRVQETGGTVRYAARFRADGAPDASLAAGQGPQGTARVPTDWGTASAIEVDGANRILIAGGIPGSGPARMMLGRLLESGAPDSAFGTGGKTAVDTGGPPDSPYTILLQGDGRILVAGEETGSGAIPTFLLARFNADGSPDPGFGAGGFVKSSIGSGQDAALDSAGRIVMVGTGNGQPGPRSGLLLARFLGDPVEEEPAGKGGVAGAVDASGRGVEVHRLRIPKSRRLLLSEGVRVLASCELDCRIVLELHVGRRTAAQMGLSGTIIGRGEAVAAAGQRRWVLAKVNKTARAGVRRFSGAGKLKIKVLGEAP